MVSGGEGKAVFFKGVVSGRAIQAPMDGPTPRSVQADKLDQAVYVNIKKVGYHVGKRNGRSEYDPNTCCVCMKLSKN